MKKLIIERISGGGQSKNLSVKGFYESFGFTLSEVLITLGIIGIVAALTLPSVINKYEKKVTVERLKQTYSMFNQAIIASEAVNGDLKDWIYSDSETVEEDVFFNTYLRPYMKGVEKYSKPMNLWKRLDGTIDTDGSSMYSRPKYKLPNGVIFSVYSRTFTDVNLYKTSAWIIVDINGEKNPNRAGRDVFFMGIYPYLPKETGKISMGIHEQCGSGQIHTRLSRDELLNEGCATCRKDYSGRGYSCGLLIQKDGWEIKDDYPW